MLFLLVSFSFESLEFKCTSYLVAIMENKMKMNFMIAILLKVWMTGTTLALFHRDREK